jgi:hypothetical protein
MSISIFSLGTTEQPHDILSTTISERSIDFHSDETIINLQKAIEIVGKAIEHDTNQEYAVSPEWG